MPVVDSILTLTLLTIVLSGGEFKRDCHRWWKKALEMVKASGLHKVDVQFRSTQEESHSPHATSQEGTSVEAVHSREAQEERRRLFWLLFSLDRHLALSHNTRVNLDDADCDVFVPLPDALWEDFDVIPEASLPPRILGPPTVVTGTSFFEYFLPLMAAMGDVIEIRRRRLHPRLGELNNERSIAIVAELLAANSHALEQLESQAGPAKVNNSTSPPAMRVDHMQRNREMSQSVAYPNVIRVPDSVKIRLVTAYSTYILHVLHILLYGKWDAISMLEDDGEWIVSERFLNCGSHAISASEELSRILSLDPELTFMPYLFGIYLLHGSFILLLFADRMPVLGSNESVERACETIIRALEVSVATLSTEFQVCPQHAAVTPISDRADYQPENLSQDPEINLEDCQRWACSGSATESSEEDPVIVQVDE